MQAPQNRQENKKFRAQILAKADKDNEFQALLRQKAARGWRFFINTFCWTYDPRESTPHIPFILYPRQEELIEYLEDKLQRARKGEQVAVVLDKPRDVGATFTVMTWGLWHFLFDEFSFRVGSRKEDYVDKKGDSDTLFFKIDYNMDRLPKFLLPQGYQKNKHRGSMMMMNPENSNAISGESANPNFGRGGRKSAIVFDEIGFWDWARSSWESAGESTNLRICMSTPPETGRDSHFYKLRIGERGKVYIFNFEWNDVPGRNKEWLEQKRNNKSDAEFAREIMKSYEGSTEGKVYAEDMKYVTLSDADYDPNLPLYISWDFGLDTVAMIWLQKDSYGNIYVIDYYENSNKEIGFYVPFVTGHLVSSPNYEYTEQDQEIIRRHYYWSSTIEHFGDPSVESRNLATGKSTKDVLGDYNIFIQCKSWSGRNWTDLRDLTRPLFKRLVINEQRCEYLISCLRNARYPHRTGMSTGTSMKPVHDWCVAGDTRVRTLNGWKFIKDIAVGEYVWGYNGVRLIPSVVSWSGKTGEKSSLLEIGIDNGESIKCTPEHRFMLRDGSYLRADELREGESLMPFYARNHKVRFVRPVDSEDVYDLTVPGLNNFVAEGVVIHNSSHGRSALEFFADNEPGFIPVGAGTAPIVTEEGTGGAQAEPADPYDKYYLF